MMHNRVRAVVESLHARSVLVAMVAAGAGSQALTWLLGIPGASRTVLEAVVPYGARAMFEYLGWLTPQHVSAQIAVALSAAAYARGQRFAEADAPVVGLSCTATIATDRPKRGRHRAHVSVWGAQSVVTYSLELEKGLRDRAGEELVVSQLALHALAEQCQLPESVPIDLAPSEALAVAQQPVGRPLGCLLDGTVDSLVAYAPGVMVPNLPVKAAILSGSFNPLHDGHIRLARVALAMLDLPVIFEISVRNVDKPPLSIAAIEPRLTQFDYRVHRVALSREPLYANKAALYPGSVFIVGYDTARRTVDPYYYDDDPEKMKVALAAVRAAGCRFLVAGRLGDEGFRTIANLPIPPEFIDLFEGIPEDRFRLDISSTELRRRAGG